MIKNCNSLDNVKREIFGLKEKPVEVTLNLGRNKIVSYYGKLSGIYPALFTVMPFDNSFKGRTSYSYSECMCGRVKLKEQTEN